MAVADISACDVEAVRARMRRGSRCVALGWIVYVLCCLIALLAQADSTICVGLAAIGVLIGTGLAVFQTVNKDLMLVNDGDLGAFALTSLGVAAIFPALPVLTSADSTMILLVIFFGALAIAVIAAVGRNRNSVRDARIEREIRRYLELKALTATTRAENDS